MAAERWRVKLTVKAETGTRVLHEETFTSEARARSHYEALTLPGHAELQVRRAGAQRFVLVDAKGELA